MQTRPHPDLPVTNDVELRERWSALLHLDGPPSERRLFLTWLRNDGTMVKMLIPVEDLDPEPRRDALGNLAGVHGVVAEAEGIDPSDLHLAMCLERPGPPTSTPDDAAWCAAIETVVRRRDGIDCSLHLHDGRTATALLPRRGWPER